MAITWRSHHIALKSVKFQETKAFYTETLGMPILAGIPGTPVVFTDLGGTTIELMPAQEAGESPKSGFAHLAFQVEDVDVAYEELAAKGIPFHIESRNMGDIRLAFFRDPDGNELELFCCPTIKWA
jgi:glyoxylase I family protein